MIVRVDGVDLWCCDFCGKRRSLVRVLISAPNNKACICDECVDVSAEIVAEQTAEQGKEQAG